LAIYLNNEQDRVPLDLDHWQHTAERIAAFLGEDPETTEWSLTFVDDEAIRTFNREYRGYDKPTDVLSFSQLEGEDDFAMPEGEEDVPERLLGDVVISVERARSQAEERGHAFEAELALLIAHGLLHLLGEDHDTPEKKDRMWARQAEVLEDLGLEIKDFGDA
jgi:probable rRNA maturation factor